MGNIFQLAALAAFIVNSGLGILVLCMNPHRSTNRFFLLTSFTLAVWLGSLAHISFLSSPQAVTFWIRNATAVSCFLLPTFDLLRLSIISDEKEKSDFFRQSIPWVVLLCLAIPFVYHPSFIVNVTFGPSGFPRPVYGWARIVYVAYTFLALGILTKRFKRNLEKARGIQRQELEFTVLAFTAAAAAALACGQILPNFTNFTDAPQLMPLAVILLDVIVAYGIATRRIMNVSDALRRATAYGLLVAYTAILYFAALYSGLWLFGLLTADPSTLAHFLAAIVIAFSLAPAHGWAQNFASRLFVHTEKIDIRGTVCNVQDTLARVGPLDDLTDRFGDMIRAAAGTDRLLLLMAQDGSYAQVYPKATDRPPLRISATDGLVNMIRGMKGPITQEGLRRMRPTPLCTAAAASLVKLNATLAAGVYRKNRMDVILLLGKRLSGRLYGPEEQDALQIVCNQFGVAFENARLFTELQDSKIYNDILVDSLVSGIVAVNANGEISVFNKEAQRITGLSAKEVVDHTLDALPANLAAAIREPLERGTEVMDRELIVDWGDELKTPIRLSCSAFQSYTGASLGVLGVFSDLTLLKKLEEQIRRSDRLSSIGTLAAGMAHEIKNPLVSISTFTQLLPERYDEEDFRTTFSSLIGKEVQRIDLIVSRLLKFSRPAKPQLQPIQLHDALNDSIHLIEQQLRRKNITLTRTFEAENDWINGDIDLLSQTFINFFLNAIEAMDDNGILTVSTTLIQSRWYRSRTHRQDARVRLSIGDTGCGIDPKDVAKIFDPFFTTKSTGTGLGLSVSHNIVDEHGATIEVETEKGNGTTFHLFFPVCPEKEITL